MADLLSVGIDIGTSTTQLVFSRITMENTSGYFAVPRVSIVDQDIVYRSGVHVTPLRSHVLIDGAAVRELVAGEYRLAGVAPEQVDTGAVIITGESARKDNAAAVLEELSGFAGEFVVSTAGPDLESIIAGKGSGAWAWSLEHHAVTANLDIGGGTTNIVIFDDGAAVAKGCLDIGGRLVRVESNGTVTYAAPAARRLAASLDLTLEPGAFPGEADLSLLTDKMADLLAQALGLRPQEPLLQEIQTPGSSWLDPGALPPIERVFFSGGVAKCLAEDASEPYPFGDIGVLLGRSVRRGLLYRSFPVGEGRETIRATVAGAGMYTTTLSGSTITYTGARFPLKNVPVLKLTEAEQAPCWEGESAGLAEKLRWFREQSGAEVPLLALPGRPDPSYRELQRLAGSMAQALEAVLPPGAPVLAAVECDIAKALGVLLDRALDRRRDVVCIDSVRMEQGDYVDLGKPLFDGLVIPVVVKTLLFG